eukprot:m51a1_g11290 putative prenylated rab acceptor family protein (214) ;mRNA; r:44321-45179
MLNDAKELDFQTLPPSSAASSAAPLAPSAPAAPAPASAAPGGFLGATAAAVLPAAAVIGSRVRSSAAARAWQPWAKFRGDRSRYGVPGPKDAAPRVRSNLLRFRLNYLSILGVFLALVALLDFKVFLLALASIGAWVYLFYWRSEPVVVGGRPISETALGLALAAFTLLVLWLVMGTWFWAVVALWAASCLLHSVFYISDEENIDFSTTSTAV